ncbi:unnamed protein product [Medioppia subpectinata]|uniref:Nuclear receptor domain-containing protein n=1 Tax=Medioppia subpectinata TaxID=1979941 RepID=A0A7R9KBW5_9ACAR|nr:unnamed protein product [Medioppia subpectinata]CAG2100619.1 unnamed protein product [Medioppia subpectinata]
MEMAATLVPLLVNDVKRNGLKNKLMYCPSNGKCIINPLMRQLCRKCRLDKCFAVGMKKELILKNDKSDRQKQLTIKNTINQKGLEENLDINLQNNTLFNETFIEIDLNHNLIDYVLNSNISYEQIISHELPIIPISSGLTDYNGLKQLEINRISELMRASVVFNYPLISNGLTYKIENLEQLMRDFSYLDENLITDIISFTKGLMGFNNMCADDRLALVKYNTKDLISISTLRHYDRETGSFITPIGNNHALQLDLRAITLFNPNQPNLMHRNAVKLEQQLRYDFFNVNNNPYRKYFGPLMQEHV